MRGLKLVLIGFVGIFALFLLGVFGVQSVQNRAIGLEEQVLIAQSDIKVLIAQSDIKVQEKRRVDLVFNLADCVKQYDKHEASTLTAIAEGRGGSGDVENVSMAIMAVTESYPELKSSFTKNPAMFVFELNRIVYGCESWWRIIEREDQLQAITDADIENVWYVKALKQAQEASNAKDDSEC